MSEQGSMRTRRKIVTFYEIIAKFLIGKRVRLRDYENKDFAQVVRENEDRRNEKVVGWDETKKYVEWEGRVKSITGGDNSRVDVWFDENQPIIYPDGGNWLKSGVGSIHCFDYIEVLGPETEVQKKNLQDQLDEAYTLLGKSNKELARLLNELNPAWATYAEQEITRLTSALERARSSRGRRRKFRASNRLSKRWSKSTKDSNGGNMIKSLMSNQREILWTIIFGAIWVMASFLSWKWFWVVGTYFLFVMIVMWGSYLVQKSDMAVFGRKGEK